MQLFLCLAYRHGADDPDLYEIMAADDADRAHELFYDWMGEGWEGGEEDVLARWERIEIFRIPPVPAREGMLQRFDNWPDGCPLAKEIELDPNPEE